MRAFLVSLSWTLGLAAQGVPVPPVKPQPKTEPPARTSISNVQFDAGGWPIVPDDHSRPGNSPAVPGVEARAPASTASAPKAVVTEVPAPASGKPVAPPLVSGMQFGSPLLEVYQATRSPAAWKALGGRVASWRLTIHGAQGEVLGVREVTHTVDCNFADRDRLEYADGTLYGRVGPAVYAERHGMPRPTLVDAAEQELALFGLHLRLPWCFGEVAQYVVTGRDTQDRNGQLLVRMLLERRPPRELEIVGPELDPRPRDRFELLYEPSTGQPREFVHRFASSLQTRSVLLEDWRDVDGVRMPFRRVYVDDKLRQTTTLEITRPLQPVRVSERDFRLH